jgi:hypothetical protein
MKENPFKNKGDVVEYGKDRELLEQGQGAREIIEKLETFKEEFGFNETKLKAFQAVVDYLERQKKGKNPAMQGEFTIESVRSSVFAEKVKTANPQEYLDKILEEFARQTALEENFIEEFVAGNNALDDKAKRFLTAQATSLVGPWMVKDHVTGVTQEGDKLTVTHKNGEHYYYLDEE